jgi:hypothetical protein
MKAPSGPRSDSGAIDVRPPTIATRCASAMRAPGIGVPLHRRECALTSAASLSAAYRVLTIWEIEMSVSKNGPEGPLITI